MAIQAISYTTIWRDFMDFRFMPMDGLALAQLVRAAAVFASLVLAGCNQQLSEQDSNLIDAFAFAIDGIEENTTDIESPKYPRKREITGNSIEYYSISPNGIGYSDKEFQRKTRDSHYLKTFEQISSPAPCVFVRTKGRRFSVGKSQNDFSAFTSSDTAKFTLNNATAFEVSHDPDHPVAILFIKGPAIICYGDNCLNELATEFWGITSDNDREKIQRRQRAVSFLKNACPGKAY